MGHDTNNNEEILHEVKRRTFVERRLYIADAVFIIRPNGGTGDCMFKAVSQACNGDESGHLGVRKQVVDFIISQRWDKFKESIEIQHIQGSKALQLGWQENPMVVYSKYMNGKGTLGSSTELQAAGELFRFNFATIQEYSDLEKKNYRVENCVLFNSSQVPFYHFLFTGDFDNGHWEVLEPVDEQLPEKAGEKIPISDGMYCGDVQIVIDNTTTTVEEWLKTNTENTCDVFALNHAIARYPARNSRWPFEWSEFSFETGRLVNLQGRYYKIKKIHRTDLYSVIGSLLLAEPEAHDESLIDHLEEQVISYRLKNFSLLNYKLITQPYSHGFNTTNLKYLGMPLKGNIQDLLAAADMFGFSFQIFLKPHRRSVGVESVKFIHVDRWGGEKDKVEYFFMKLVNEEDGKIAKWWHLMEMENENRFISATGEHMTGFFDASKEMYLGGGEKINNNNILEAQSSKTPNPKYSPWSYPNPKPMKITRNIEKSGNKAVEVEPATLHCVKVADSKVEGQRDTNKMKTVVEVFDGSTKRRKTLVYQGYLPREKVLQTLVDKGYIDNAKEYEKALDQAVICEQQCDELNAEQADSTHTHFMPQSSSIKAESSTINSNSSTDRESESNTYCIMEEEEKALLQTEEMSKFLNLHTKVSPAVAEQKLSQYRKISKRKGNLIKCWCCWKKKL